jgi:hypothetical protein
MPLVSAPPRRLLARVLEDPRLPHRIASLPARELGRLVSKVGLEDAGELLAFATVAQLRDVFDEDLWAPSAPGDDATFDSARFRVWLEVMLEAGDAALATKLVALPEDLVTLAFHTSVHVVPLEALREAVEGDDDDRLEKTLANALSEEIGEYVVVARDPDGWDAVLSTLLALDRDHSSYLAGLLDRCAAATLALAEEDGLSEVLSSAETLFADAAADRADRRAKKGHLAPSDARAFLALACEGHDVGERDAITKAYFRELDREALSGARGPTIARGARALPASPALEALLAEPRDPSASAAPTAASSHAHSLLERALAKLSPEVLAVRADELAYLANVTAEGVVVLGRRLRPLEAVRAAMATVSLGLEVSLHEHGKKSSVELAAHRLETHTADALFRKGLAHLVAVAGRASDKARHAPELDLRAATAPFPYRVAEDEETVSFVDGLSALEELEARLAGGSVGA